MRGVLTRDARMVDVVAAGLASGKLVSGHAAGLTGPELQAYLCAGILSDHEIFLDGDVAERLRAGMTVELRGMIDALAATGGRRARRLPDAAHPRRGRHRRPLRAHLADRRRHRPPAAPARRRRPRSRQGHPHRDHARRLPPRALRPRAGRGGSSGRPRGAVRPRRHHRRRRVDRRRPRGQLGLDAGPGRRGAVRSALRHDASSTPSPPTTSCSGCPAPPTDRARSAPSPARW